MLGQIGKKQGAQRYETFNLNTEHKAQAITTVGRSNQLLERATRATKHAHIRKNKNKIK